MITVVERVNQQPGSAAPAEKGNDGRARQRRFGWPWVARLILALAVLPLGGCLSLRGPQAAAAHYHSLAESLPLVRDIAAEAGSKAREDSRQELAEACDPVYAVGTSLVTQARPGGRDGQTWERLRSAQRHLQVACGDLAVELSLPSSSATPPSARMATALEHLAVACATLEAAGRQLQAPIALCAEGPALPTGQAPQRTG